MRSSMVLRRPASRANSAPRGGCSSGPVISPATMRSAWLLSRSTRLTKIKLRHGTEKQRERQHAADTEAEETRQVFIQLTDIAIITTHREPTAIG